MIEDLKRLFGPTYNPSPGAVYPAIQALVAERLVLAEADRRAKRYACSVAGRRLLEQRRGLLAEIEERTGARLRDETTLRPMLDRFAGRVMALSGRIEAAEVERVLATAVASLETAKEKKA